ncbi:MAG: aromatic amino acid transport family protein [Minisyncoccales bacterium]
MLLKIKKKNKNFLTAVSVIVGTIVGVGFLGIPYVAAKAGFFVTMIHLVIIGSLILIINLSFGEIILRTKGQRHITGYAYKYLGKKGKDIMFILFNLAIISALLAYMIGVGESLSFLFFGSIDYFIPIGALFGFTMSYFLWGGITSLRKFEKIGVITIIILTIFIIVFYSKNIYYPNLFEFNKSYLFLPFGVILFSLMEFFTFPAVRKILRKNEILMKRAIIIGTIIPVLFYMLFALIVVGFAGSKTPEISTIAFGPLFIILGIVTIFTSYLGLGTALERSYMLDYRNKKKNAWFKSTIIPIILFLIIGFFDFITFTRVLSIGGVFAGGLIGMMVLAIHKKANTQGNRIPEYKVNINKIIAFIIIFILIIGVITEIWSFLS